MSIPTEELKRFVEDLARTPELWRHLIRHSSEERVYDRIWDHEDVNAWLICWSANQDTGFHDHDNSEAALTVLDGHVKEERLRIGAEPDARVVGPGSTVVVPAVAIHRVLHTGLRPAVTIHAYSPPLERTGRYRTGPGGELERIAASSEHELQAEAAVA